MIWFFILVAGASLALIKLGMLSVWVHLLSVALSVTAAVLAMVVIFVVLRMLTKK